ncbi:MAG: hypothetical protein J0I34_17975 [Pseudonocardia sp.]|uniref:hypothetical protein n=1 Tax=unclassified Pseudonocardia TaxID=2619320 RepID=UPI00086A79DA|nr:MULTISPECIES: hypothetical protein [unclassified Pseudonocardia]MBN9110654.1 hypothetical protein [Pseudonocardia sp.]ODU18646.1 MAG: hypothetical protein ABS80_19970 [Pseudonocardia sp. SCN 72-51]ODV04372.1 MAG: hypothetical protein ABT15_20510 [Pseudonocardia sp. SCN 73-27]
MRDRSAGVFSLLTVAAIGAAGWLASQALTLAAYAGCTDDAVADGLLADAGRWLPAALAVTVAVAMIAVATLATTGRPASAAEHDEPRCGAGWAVLGPLAFLLVECVEYVTVWHAAPPAALLAIGVAVHASVAAALTRSARTWVRRARGLAAPAYAPVPAGSTGAGVRTGVTVVAPGWSPWVVPHRRGPP